MEEVSVSAFKATCLEWIRKVNRTGQTLTATASVYDLTLLTADARLLAGSGFRAVENA